MKEPLPLSESEQAESLARADAATTGPWRWAMNLKSKSIVLEAVCREFEIVMDFVRWGMGGAKPRFQRRLGHGCGVMEDCDKFGRVVPGREHHASRHQSLSHPDAVFIAAAREDVPRWAATVRALRPQPAGSDEYPLLNDEEREKIAEWGAADAANAYCRRVLPKFAECEAAAYRLIDDYWAAKKAQAVKEGNP